MSELEWAPPGGPSIPTLLVFLRLSAFFVSSPFPGAMAPGALRLSVAAGLAWAMAEGMPRASVPALWSAVLGEVTLGLMMGFLLHLVLHAFAFAGETVSQQMGLRMPGFANPFDPNLSMLGSAYAMMMLGFFAIGPGPLRLTAFLHRMFELIPPGGVVMQERLGQVAVASGVELFAGALHVGAPLIAAVFASQLVLAILARSVPTLNLFVEGPALTIASGIIGLVASVQTFAPTVDRLVLRRLEQIAAWLVP